ncbi:MAG: hypothetical protein ACLQBK_11100 [Candidatus Sulfotelmatobacter sp.]
MLHLLHFALAILLFFGVNWIGEHSSTFGYLRLSLHVREAPAPAFNFVLKALSPTVYIIIVSTVCYALRQDSLVRGIWLVAAYYFLFRLLFNIAFGRTTLIDWDSVLRQAIVGIGAAYLAYVHFILPRRPLLPGVESIGNQLWVIVALFLYAVFNDVRTPSPRSARRKKKYLRSRFDHFKKEYGDLIDAQFPERYMELVAYAILIYETFNRPWLARLAERAVFPWGSHTIGPMQVTTKTRLSDRESVVVGTQQLRRSFEMSNQELLGKRASRYDVIKMAVAKYNRDDDYIGEVFQVLHILWAQVATDYRAEFETMYTRPTL